MLSEEEAEKLRKQLLAQLENVPEEQAQQAEILKEQIKKATPEQLEAFIAQARAGAAGGAAGGACLFCQIIEGKIETVRIYEDPDILCVLDLYPAAKGHMLILPKRHFQFIHEIPDALLNKLFIFAKTIEPILKDVVEAQGMSIYVAQDEAAGQRVPHFCINIIPRYKNDKISFDWPRQKAEKKEIEQVAEKLREKASKEVKQKFEFEVKKAEKKKKAEEASEAEKILRHIKPRMP